GRDGCVNRLNCGGQALSISSGQHYEQEEIFLTEGDRLILFTDGITETTDRRGEEFGEDRLLAILRENRVLGASKIQKNVLGRISEFNGKNFQDDATLILLAVG
ncbi:MAG TPA: PP2C family protein-serine/threonine phosphatase, partial [Candidatus Acidoferrales bacterium]|nr:PP2C family protein-serine/threonine phosphatase [Candidatus Acidoferrales bacterium]